MTTRDNPPNLLFIFSDQQRQDTLACYGNNQIQMPNLNRLADESVVFDSAYVTQSLCTPSRSSIMTGLYPHANNCGRNNQHLAAEFPCLPEMIQNTPYRSAYHGKWHLGDEIFRQHGFDEWVSAEDMYRHHYSPERDRNERSDYHHFLLDQGLTPKGDGDWFSRQETIALPEELGKPAFLAGTARRFLKENRDNPFILYVNFLEPHYPYGGPRSNQYDPADIPLPKNYESVPGPDDHLRNRYLKEHWRRKGKSGFMLETPEDWRTVTASYWGNCGLVDTHAGRILDALDEYGLRDDTIVVFTSDHGDLMGSHQLICKSVMYEEAVKVPLLIRLPGQRESRRARGPMSQIDLVPTLLDCMNQNVPDGLHGESLRPQLDQPGDVTLDRDVFIEWNGPAAVGKKATGEVEGEEWAREIASPDKLRECHSDPIRTVVTPEGWKFNWSLKNLGDELFNLNDDPYETRNLAPLPEQKELIGDLRGRIETWREATNDVDEDQQRDCDK